jgi:flagellar secretion chaperone FliS
MRQYREATLEGASGVDLIVALYDALVRFLLLAAAACEQGEVEARREAVRRAIDIVIHLQARLRMDIGGAPAEGLGEFYASIFANILRASASASQDRFVATIKSVRNVREAWQELAQDPAVRHVMPRDLQTYEERMEGATMRMAVTTTSSEERGWRA